MSLTASMGFKTEREFQEWLLFAERREERRSTTDV